MDMYGKPEETLYFLKCTSPLITEMAPTWNEIEVAHHEKRHELVLTGAEVSERIDKNGLDEAVFNLETLNFLEISKTSLTALSPKLCNLSNLTNLVLHNNKLETVPEDLGKLSKLKFLDLSSNNIKSLPKEIGELHEVHTVNISCNSLVTLPDVSKLVHLHILDLSHNKFEGFPEGLTSPELALLAQVFFNGNALEELPADLSELPSLKTLDVSDNKLVAIPAEISECQKLKEFRYGGNKLKDRRLAKMMDQCSTKAVLDYLHAILEKERKASGGKSKDKKRKKKGKAKDEEEELSKNLMKVLRFEDASGFTVTVTDSVLDVRPYIVCCIIHQLNLNRTKNMFKRFLTYQTKLHDTTCKKRQFATIATHDLKAVDVPLTYDARTPASMHLTPLGKLKETTADKLMDRLHKEADDFRKEKKRSTVSGIHQYLELLRDHEEYPCVVDSKGVLISFPPITNCDKTKVSRETTSVLVEVTSSDSLDACKRVMDEFLHGLLEMGVGGAQGAEAGPPGVGPELPAILTSDQVLSLQQVKVVDASGALKVVYPSRVDLQNEAFRVDRD